jgi:hypothetical protein
MFKSTKERFSQIEYNNTRNTKLIADNYQRLSSKIIKLEHDIIKLEHDMELLKKAAGVEFKNILSKTVVVDSSGEILAEVENEAPNGYNSNGLLW